MRIHPGLVVLVACLIVLAGCGEKSEESELIVKEGNIQGKVTDSETGAPVEGASVTIGDQTVITDKNGSYTIAGVPLSGELEIAVSASEYKDYKGTTSLQEELLVLNFGLVPDKSEKARILEVLEGLSEDIGALDPNRIPAIQARLSEDYTVGDDEATASGVFIGIIPPSYEGTPEAMEKIIEKYSKLEFVFAESEVKLDGNMASVEMLIEIYAETKQTQENPAKKWELAIRGKMDFSKENSDWKIIFWELIPPFLKFEEEPL